MTPAEYLSSLQEPDDSSIQIELAAPNPDIKRMLKYPSLYYPGSGTDRGPFDLFTRHGTLSTVVYIDYGLKRDDVHNFVAALQDWHCVNIGELQPSDLGETRWADFWPNHPAGQTFFGPQNAYCLWAVLQSTPTSRLVFFLFLATEAIHTFEKLLHIGFNPQVVVLQDHGFGSNWAKKFGGASPLFRIAQVNPPMLTYVADTTDPWYGYQRVSDYGLEGPSSHSRALFVLVGKH